MTRTLACATAMLTLLLTACGGGDDDDRLQALRLRGSIVSAQLVTADSPSRTRGQIDEQTTTAGLLPLSGLAQCDVDLRQIVYRSVDPAGHSQTTSTAVMVPTGSGSACGGSRPVLLYVHGTEVLKLKNMTDVAGDREAAVVMAMFAAHGFIVVAPDYLGYSSSSLDFHPYLNAQSQSDDMIDALRAAQTHLKAVPGAQPSSQLFVTGYSQGGYVAMATHQALERGPAGPFTVTASGPMSGPYNLVGFADQILGPGPVNAGATLFFPLLTTSYQRSYGDIYDSSAEIYNSPFDGSIETLLPSDVSEQQLLQQGKLPADPAEGDEPTFSNLVGPGGLLTDRFVAGYPTSRLRSALQLNTMLGWTPQHPMALCGGANDPVVFFPVNSQAAAQDFAARNAPVTLFDLEDEDSLSGPLGAAGTAIYVAFQGLKVAALDYHAELVPVPCMLAERTFFQRLVQP